MKYLRGYLAAAIFAAISYVLAQYGQRFSTLIDMIYPYVIRTMEGYLAQWSSQVDFLLWQFLAVVLGVVVLFSVVLMVILKWNPIQWFGWVLAGAAGLFLVNTLFFGLNYYAGDLAEDIRLEVSGYTLDELKEATEYYRDKANALSSKVKRDANGNVQYPDFETLAKDASQGFQYLTYNRFYPIFAGSTLPVKKLGWADFYSSAGITGYTMGLTGEAAVNPQIPQIELPFAMCHEMSHRMCIVSERDANFAAFLACAFNDEYEFRYSAYFMAYRYCITALRSVRTAAAAQAAQEIAAEVNQAVNYDMRTYDMFYQSSRDDGATAFADKVNDSYLKANGEKSGIASYGKVCDLLVNWHIQEVVIPAITIEEDIFDPYDETQVDLSGIVNARKAVMG